MKNILDRYKDHESKQDHNSYKIDIRLHISVDGLSAYPFDYKEQESSAIQGGKRDQVKNAQIDGQHRDDI